MNTSHYPSLELCKKLTEIGFPETEYKPTQYLNSEFNEYVCPSVMEMLDVMPRTIEKNMFLECNHRYVWYVNRYYDTSVHEICWSDKTLPNALAEMILWLKENNYINFK